MSDDTPRAYCPTCEDAGEYAELLTIVYCDWHTATTAGLDDAGVVPSVERVVTNAMWCDLIHRGKVE